MTIKHAIWKVGEEPKKLADAKLESERLLEDMIVSTPNILSDEWMLIGRQEDTGHGGRIDLLAIAPDASLVLIEIKRDRTPRDVVAQALDYAGWVEGLKDDDLAGIYKRFKSEGDLKKDFKDYFGVELDEDALNDSHQIVVVAASLDDSTERIVSYLNDRNIAINVLFFQVFAHGEEQLISRAWLLDPVQTQTNVSSRQNREKEPWNGEFYTSFGHGAARSWEEAMKYGFLCAGGGSWYSKTLQLLEPGDRIWTNIPGSGYVGIGKVTGRVQPASSFIVEVDGEEVLFMDIAKQASYHREYGDIKNIEKITQQVEEMLKKHEEIDAEKTLMVNVNKFADSSVEFFIYTFTKTTDWQKFHHIKQDIMLKISNIIEKNDSEFAFPTRTLHVPEEISMAKNNQWN